MLFLQIIEEMTNVSLRELKRFCEALAAAPTMDSDPLRERCLGFSDDFLTMSPEAATAMPALEEEYWPLQIRVAMTFIFASLSVIGILGNILVILVVLKVPGMRTPTNCYLLSLALSDCLFFLATSPTELSYLHVPASTYIFGAVGCSLFTYVPYLAINTSSLSITAFTIERFIGICYPLRARYMCTVKRAKMIIIGIWLFSLFYNSPWLYLATLVYVNDGVSCSFKLERENVAYKMLYFTDLGMFYFVPMVLNILIYGKITYTLSRSTMKQNNSIIKSPKEMPVETTVTFSSPCTTAPREYFVNGGKRSSTKGKMQVIKMLLIVVIIFAVCWLPYRAMVMYNSFAESKINNDLYIFFAKTLIFVNCAINPVLYNVMSARFRNAFRRLLGDDGKKGGGGGGYYSNRQFSLYEEGEGKSLHCSG